MRRLVLAVVLLVGCAPANGAKSAEGPQSRYRKGDFVHYRYSGTYTTSPVEFVEVVADQHGLVLEIEVDATRGEEHRTWLQIVTDTPYNQKNNVVDALYVVENGQKRKLKNVNNNDLYALYDWTYVVPEGIPTDLAETDVDRTIGGVTYHCRAKSGRTHLKGKAVRFEEVDCKDFLWTHAGAQFVDEESGAMVYRAEVVEVGRR
jgi:hypothetical protein